MRRPRHILLGALVGGVLAVGAAPGASGSATDANGLSAAPQVASAAATSAAEQREVKQYWTPARMA